MKILSQSYERIIEHLTSETFKQLIEVDETSTEIEPVIGIAQVHVGNGVYMTIKLDITVTNPQMMAKSNLSN